MSLGIGMVGFGGGGGGGVAFAGLPNIMGLGGRGGAPPSGRYLLLLPDGDCPTIQGPPLPLKSSSSVLCRVVSGFGGRLLDNCSRAALILLELLLGGSNCLLIACVMAGDDDDKEKLESPMPAMTGPSAGE